MVVGHLGIAYLGKATRPTLPLALLAIAAYGPDLFRFAASPLPIETRTAEIASHSIPAVLVIGAVIALVAARRVGGIAAALMVIAVCGLHWPADVFTGCKPVLGGEWWVGFIRYRHPALDVPVELGLFFAGWLACRRTSAARQKRFAYSVWILLAAVVVQIAFLASLYAGSEFFIGRREWTWHPNEGPFAFRRVGDPETLFCRPPEALSAQRSALTNTGRRSSRSVGAR
jgi:hypothetical protein